MTTLTPMRAERMIVVHWLMIVESEASHTPDPKGYYNDGAYRWTGVTSRLLLMGYKFKLSRPLIEHCRERLESLHRRNRGIIASNRTPERIYPVRDGMRAARSNPDEPFTRECYGTPIEICPDPVTGKLCSGCAPSDDAEAPEHVLTPSHDSSVKNAASKPRKSKGRKDKRPVKRQPGKK